MDQHISLVPLLERIAQALERLCPAPAQNPDWNSFQSFLWDGSAQSLKGIDGFEYIELELFKNIDQQKQRLLTNTENFLKGKSAQNALLWGARGMGKSSLVKSVFKNLTSSDNNDFKIVEIYRQDISTLLVLMNILKSQPYRFLLFCDDLSFEKGDPSYKFLKTALEGGLEGRPDNVIFYATSNRRHLVPRDMLENERSTAINPYEAVEENVSLSDRFGLWIGFHASSQEEYLEMVRGYAEYFRLRLSDQELVTQALEWSAQRGNRSGRTAWQFIQSLGVYSQYS